MRTSRYHLDEPSKVFLQTVVDTSMRRVKTINAGSSYWRAQDGHTWEDLKVTDEEGNTEIGSVKAPHPAERMIPRLGRAIEGRVNAKGIPCLYLASSHETAIGEMRGWIGSFISVAKFAISRDVSIIDCTNDSSKDTPTRYWDPEPSPTERENYVWRTINTAFSEPVGREDDIADYAPTQIIAETFKASGYDGVLYDSLVGDGQSLALFDRGVAEPITCQLYVVTDMKHTSVPQSDEYSIKRKG